VSEQRIAAREKLSRLLQNQLQDLSTDVYDELKRRTDTAQGKKKRVDRKSGIFLCTRQFNLLGGRARAEQMKNLFFFFAPIHPLDNLLLSIALVHKERGACMPRV